MKKRFTVFIIKNLIIFNKNIKIHKKPFFEYLKINDLKNLIHHILKKQVEMLFLAFLNH